MKPLLLVDVDGVINVFGSNSPHAEWEHEFLHSGQPGAGGFWIQIPVGTTERFRRLAEHFELIWGTGWMGDAHRCFGHLLELGDPWPFIDVSAGFINASYERDAGARNAQTLSWKLPCIKKWVDDNAHDRPVAWIDDDLFADARMWAIERNDRVPTRLVKTECHIGMADEHVDDLVAWAQMVQEIEIQGLAR